MSDQSQQTTDHQTIKDWVEARGGKPATVEGTGDNGQAGILRINFNDNDSGEDLKDISWDEFFDKFDESQLAFLYQDQTADGQQSRFCKFVQRPGTSTEAGGQ